MPEQVIIVVLSMLPISELRGAIPYGLIKSGMPLAQVLPLAIVGNLIPVLPLLILFEPVSNYLRKYALLKKFFDWLDARTLRKAQLVQKYEALGLILFVAVPLPVTGAWTGAFAATLFKLKKGYAFAAISLGVLIASVVVTLVTLLGRGIVTKLFLAS